MLFIISRISVLISFILLFLFSSYRKETPNAWQVEFYFISFILSVVLSITSIYVSNINDKLKKRIKEDKDKHELKDKHEDKK